MSRRILLVEPFFAGSHAAWAEGWQSASRHDIHLLTHEGAAWRWRMRGSAVTLAAATADWVAEHGTPDVVVATDMLDVAAYLGLTRRVLGDPAVALYLHENQLTYPRRPGEALDQGLAWAMWRSLVAADEVWCNSDFHRDEVRTALGGFLADVPDRDHLGLLPEIAARLVTLHVGVDLAGISPPPTRENHPGGPLVLSNQRWHHDKDLGSVLRALRRLAERGRRFRVALVGDDRGGERAALQPLVDDLGDRVVHAGLLPRHDYIDLLGRADVVVSAARNEFFGIAVVEALAAGAIPVLPDALAYPEVVPARFHAAALYREGELTSALESAITDVEGRRAAVAGLAQEVRRFDWSVMAPRYDDSVERLVASQADGEFRDGSSAR